MVETASPPKDTRQLPLFPLSSVLFPGSSLPLRIFEERYRLMIGRCVESDRREFAVHLITDGDEVVERGAFGLPEGAPAVPATIGTVAEIVNAVRLPDGGYRLVCIGRQRIRIKRILRSRPYLIGRVEHFPDEDATSTDSGLLELVAQVRRATERLLGVIQDAIPRQRVEARAQVRKVAESIPVAPVELSFFVPRALSSASATELQELLEMSSVRKRLRLELPYIVREQEVLRELRRQGGEHGQEGRNQLN